MLGGYAAVAEFETFLKKRGDAGPRNDLARLAGARLVIASEVQEGRAFDEAVVKSITGGDMITARYLYQESFEFRPQFTLWLAGNSRPAISAHDSGMWRRILLVPFPLTIPEGKRDPSLKQRLTSHPDSQAAILDWAVRGCQEWQEHRLAVPEAVLRQTRAYRADNDPLRNWLAARCRFDADARTPAGHLREDHRLWCEDNEAAPAANKAWGHGLRQRGLELIKSRGEKFWHGITLLQEDR
jgi:putative DNA primase/helicase